MVIRGGSDGGTSTIIQNVYSKLMRFTAYQNFALPKSYYQYPPYCQILSNNYLGYYLFTLRNVIIRLTEK